MVIITSDHGQPMGNGEHGHGIMRKCRPWPYEELVHVPLLIHVPGLEGGKRIESFVQNVDVTATMMDALGYGQSALSEAGHEGIQTYGADEMHGISLLPVMRGETDTVREVAIAGYYGMSWSLITKDWSYIHWLKNDIDTDEMNRLFYDGSGKGGNAGRQSAELEMKEEIYEEEKRKSDRVFIYTSCNHKRNCNRSNSTHIHQRNNNKFSSNAKFRRKTCCQTYCRRCRDHLICSLHNCCLWLCNH